MFSYMYASGLQAWARSPKAAGMLRGTMQMARRDGRARVLDPSKWPTNAAPQKTTIGTGRLQRSAHPPSSKVGRAVSNRGLSVALMSAAQSVPEIDS